MTFRRRGMNYKIRKMFASFSLIFALTLGVFAPANLVYAASGDTTVYITKTGDCYHADGCSSLRKSKISTTLQNAVSKGYRACSKCHPASLDATSTTTANSATVSKSAATTTKATLDPAVEALKTYKGNNSEFNAYTYYTNNADLQTAIGTDGDKLLKHYNEYGKAEGRKAK